MKFQHLCPNLLKCLKHGFDHCTIVRIFLVVQEISDNFEWVPSTFLQCHRTQGHGIFKRSIIRFLICGPMKITFFQFLIQNFWKFSYQVLETSTMFQKCLVNCFIDLSFIWRGERSILPLFNIGLFLLIWLKMFYFRSICYLPMLVFALEANVFYRLP